jgi:hypothetical protein
MKHTIPLLTADGAVILGFFSIDNSRLGILRSKQNIQISELGAH